MLGNTVVNEKEGVTYLTFPLFEKAGVKHGFSTRLGGVSKGDFAAMNLSFTRGDNPEDVMTNHKIFAGAVGYSVENLVFSNQVHDTVIRRVDASDCGRGLALPSFPAGVDGLVTEDEEVVLMTFFADCVPLFFYDPVRRAVGASHSGWRGTVGRIGAKTVEVMRREFGTKPEDLLVVIGPSICSSCYEVSGEVAQEFRQIFNRDQWHLVLESKPAQKYQLDLWMANRIILEEAGISRDHIEVSEVCTCCHKDLLFSHRATGGKRGNLAGVLSLAPVL